MSNSNTTPSGHVAKLLTLLKDSEESRAQAFSILEALDDEDIKQELSSHISIRSYGTSSTSSIATSYIVIERRSINIPDNITFFIQLLRLNLLSVPVIKELQVANVTTEVLREVCSYFTDLEHLSIVSYYWHNQSITALPKELELCTKLKSLSIQNQNSLTSFELTKPLQIKTFNGTSITEKLLEDLIPYMPNLTTLNCSKDTYRSQGFNTFPKSITKLTKLKKLSITNHYTIDNIPSFIQELKHLRTLDLSACSITSLPSFLNTMDQLAYINVSNTRVKYVPKGLLLRKTLRSIKMYSISGLIHFTFPEFLEKVKVSRNMYPNCYPHISRHRTSYILQDYVHRYLQS